MDPTTITRAFKLLSLIENKRQHVRHIDHFSRRMITSITRSNQDLKPQEPFDDSWANDKAVLDDELVLLADGISSSLLTASTEQNRRSRPNTPPSAAPAITEQRIVEIFNTLLDARENRRSEAEPSPRIRQDTVETAAPPVRIIETETLIPTDRVRVDDIGLFDPQLLNDTLPEDLIVTEGKHTVYKEVYTFVDRLEAVAAAFTTTEVVRTFSKCLRGQALIWHTAELSANTRSTLNFVTLANITALLIQRFKLNPSAALSGLRQRKYGLREVKSSHIQTHFGKAFTYARHLGIIDEYILNLQVWNTLEPEIQALIDEPNPLERRHEFLARASQKWPVLQGLARRPATQFGPVRHVDSLDRRTLTGSSGYRPQQNPPGGYPPWKSQSEQSIPSTQGYGRRPTPLLPDGSGRSKLVADSSIQRAYTAAVMQGNRNVGFFALNDDGTLEQLEVDWSHVGQDNSAKDTLGDTVD